MVMVHFYRLILNIDDVCLKLYTIFSKFTLFAGSTVRVSGEYIEIDPVSQSIRKPGIPSLFRSTQKPVSLGKHQLVPAS